MIALLAFILAAIVTIIAVIISVLFTLHQGQLVSQHRSNLLRAFWLSLFFSAAVILVTSAGMSFMSNGLNWMIGGVTPWSYYLNATLFYAGIASVFVLPLAMISFVYASR